MPRVSGNVDAAAMVYMKSAQRLVIWQRSERHDYNKRLSVQRHEELGSARVTFHVMQDYGFMRRACPINVHTGLRAIAQHRDAGEVSEAFDVTRIDKV